MRSKVFAVSSENTLWKWLMVQCTLMLLAPLLVADVLSLRSVLLVSV